MTVTELSGVRRALRRFIKKVCEELQKASLGKPLPTTRVAKITLRPEGGHSVEGQEVPNLPFAASLLLPPELYQKLPEYHELEDTIKGCEKVAGWIKLPKNVEPPERWRMHVTFTDPFLSQYLLESGSFVFDQQVFERTFVQFASFLARPHIGLKTIAYMEGLEGDCRRVRLGGVLIRRLDNEEREKLYNQFEVRMGFQSDPFSSILFLHYIAEADTTVSKERAAIDSSPAVGAIDRAVTALRLFKPGFVHRHRTYTRGITLWDFHGTTGGLPRARIWGHTRKYLLGEQEGGVLRRFFNTIQTILADPKPPLSIALKRFNDAYERQQDEDRLLDLFIALEALFLKGGEQAELSYRLAQRAALFIEHPTKKPAEVSADIGKGYGFRSKVVHGEPIDSGKLKETVPLVEEYVRLALRKMLLACAHGISQDTVIQEIDKRALLGKALTFRELLKKERDSEPGKRAG